MLALKRKRDIQCKKEKNEFPRPERYRGCTTGFMGGALAGCQDCLYRLHTEDGSTHYHSVSEYQMIENLGEQASLLKMEELLDQLETDATDNEAEEALSGGDI